MVKPDLNIMRAAIEDAEANNTPFGAAIAMGNEIFVTSANQSKRLHDPTAHAEIIAIRKLCEHLKKTDLSGFTLYTTCEPCSMCMSAVIWARINTVFYGCGIPEISRYIKQIRLRAEDVVKAGFHTVAVTGSICEAECEDLLRKFL